MAVISMKNNMPVMPTCYARTWCLYRCQLMYTKFVIAVDDDVNVRNWQDVIWAITTGMDPARDLTILVIRRLIIWISRLRFRDWASSCSFL